MFGWNKKKEVMAVVDPRSVFGTEEWLGAVSDEDFVSLVEHLEEKVTEAFSVKRTANPKDTTFLTQSLSTLLKLAKTSPQPFRAEAIEGKYNRVWFALFKLVKNTLVEVNTYDEDTLMPVDVATELRSKLVKYTDKFSEDLRKHKPKVDVFADFALAGGLSRFIPRSTSFAVVNDGVAKLSALLAKVDESILTVENNYFVEQVKEVYIPELVNSAISMKTVEGDERVKAEANFVRQLGLIESKLTIVISESTENVLSNVENQTLFLEQALATSPKQLEMKVS